MFWSDSWLGWARLHEISTMAPFPQHPSLTHHLTPRRVQKRRTFETACMRGPDPPSPPGGHDERPLSWRGVVAAAAGAPWRKRLRPAPMVAQTHGLPLVVGAESFQNRTCMFTVTTDGDANSQEVCEVDQSCGLSVGGPPGLDGGRQGHGGRGLGSVASSDAGPTLRAARSVGRRRRRAATFGRGSNGARVRHDGRGPPSCGSKKSTFVRRPQRTSTPE